MNRLASAALLLLSTTVAAAQVPAPHAAPTPSEVRATRGFEAARKAGAPELYAFLKPFPKGADLHMHLSGAVYAETFIAEAAQQGLCLGPVDPAPAPGLPPTPMAAGTVRFFAPLTDPSAPCGSGGILVAEALKNQRLYDDMIDSFSMRGFVPSDGITGHDQFFNTFDRFGGLKNFTGAWLDEVATRAAAQNEQYLEIMNTPSFNHVFSAIAKAPWPVDVNDANHLQVLATYRDQLLANGLQEDIATDSKEFLEAQEQREAVEGLPTCGTSALNGPISGRLNCLLCLVPAGANKLYPPCAVKIHWLYQVLRGFPPAQVFAQTLLGFELASARPEQVVGINFVRAEDRRDAIAEYHTEMLMLDYLHSVYPKVRISLHAGELAFGMVPPKDLTFHIREALDLGHAERIGHGMDVLYETDAPALLQQMARQHTMVEINLTSNDVILGQTRTDHPLAAYRAAHVPWALSTDDEGVSRIDLTHEYVKGALEQGLTYADLKQSARTSLEHAFLTGPSLWLFPKTGPETFTQRTSSCAASITATGVPSAACAKFLAASERATQQFELERRLAAFEAAQ